MKNLLGMMRPAVLGIVVVFVAAGRAEAGFLSAVEVFKGGDVLASGTETATADIPGFGGAGAGTGSAFANADGIGGILKFTIDAKPSSAFEEVRGGLRATGAWSDIVIMGPTDTVEVSARSILEGIISYVAPPEFLTNTNVFARVTISGVDPAGGTHSAFTQNSNIGVNFDTDTVLSEILQTPFLLIDTQFPVAVEMHLEVEGLLQSPLGSTAPGSLTADFGNTMRFVTEDVFIYPKGSPRTRPVPASSTTRLCLAARPILCPNPPRLCCWGWEPFACRLRDGAAGEAVWVRLSNDENSKDESTPIVEAVSHSAGSRSDFVIFRHWITRPPEGSSPALSACQHSGIPSHRTQPGMTGRRRITCVCGAYAASSLPASAVWRVPPASLPGAAAAWHSHLYPAGPGHGGASSRSSPPEPRSAGC